eukprot:6555935-Prymnesium_polylepis.1
MSSTPRPRRPAPRPARAFARGSARGPPATPASPACRGRRRSGCPPASRRRGRPPASGRRCGAGPPRRGW